jgi:hypothetical protein
MCILLESRLILAFTERNHTTPQVGRMFLGESFFPRYDERGPRSRRTSGQGRAVVGFDREES